MTTCSECGGTVRDNVCTRCGSSVWPQATPDQEAASPSTPPSVGAPGDSAQAPAAEGAPSGPGRPGEATGPGYAGFVNPPDDMTPPPPASTAPPPPPPPSTTPPPPAGPDEGWGATTPPPPAGHDEGWEAATPPPPGGPDEGWEASADTGDAPADPGSSRRVLWWVLGGLAVLALGGVLAVWLFLRGAGLTPGDIERVGEATPERLAELRAGCDAGDMQACDDLYLESPFDSEDETFGDTCGGRNDPSGWCVDIHGETAPPN